MTPAEAPPGTWGYQVCAAASLAFLRPWFARCAVWSWGAQPDCGLCVAGLVQYKFSKFTRCSKFNRSFFANFVDKLADDGDAMLMMMVMIHEKPDSSESPKLNTHVMH